MAGIKYVLAIDPSGNYDEGKGVTGWAIIRMLDCAPMQSGTIHANEYASATEYWQVNVTRFSQLSRQFELEAIVLEDYLIYADKATAQIHSRCETPQLIGIIKLWAYRANIPIILQSAALAKKRWTDTILEHEGIISFKGKSPVFADRVICKHELDAVRHATHYATFKKGKRLAILRDHNNAGPQRISPVAVIAEEGYTPKQPRIRRKTNDARHKQG